MLVGVASIGYAVGVPIALRARGKSSSSAISPAGGGRRSAQLKVEICSSRGGRAGSPIAFGEPDSGQVCWDHKDDLGVVESLSDFSSFFSEEWKEPERTWTTSKEQSQWAQQCQSQASPWSVMTTSSGAQYLGWCRGTSLAQTKFVKKVKDARIAEGKSGWNFWICNAECWETDVGTFGGSAEVAEKEKGENWKSVEFYKS